MSKHTAGLWTEPRKYDLHTCFRIYGPGEQQGRTVEIASVHYHTPGMGPFWCVGEQEALANARLIAAAPKMLTALKSIRDTLRAAGGRPMPTLDAVIAEAEGRDA